MTEISDIYVPGKLKFEKSVEMDFKFGILLISIDWGSQIMVRNGVALCTKILCVLGKH